MASAFDDLPVIPHQDIADADCCGCLMVRVRGGEADMHRVRGWESKIGNSR
jgi:hypothetical protein